MTLFDPILSQNHRSLSSIDASYVRAHGILFSEKHTEKLPQAQEEFLSSLDLQIGRMTRRWMEMGYQIAVTNLCAILDYGNADNVVMRALAPQKSEDSTDVEMTGTAREAEHAITLCMSTHEVVFRRFGDPNIYPYLHAVMVFMYHVTFYPPAMAHLEKRFPWQLLAIMLNTLLVNYPTFARIESGDFPESEEEPRPLPEDYAMRGLLWVERYYPADYFTSAKVDDDEKYFEMASMTDERRERVLWLACQVARHGRWLTYSGVTHHFGVGEEYDLNIVPVPWRGAGEEGGDDKATASGSSSPSTFSNASVKLASVEDAADDVFVAGTPAQ